MKSYFSYETEVLIKAFKYVFMTKNFIFVNEVTHQEKQNT